MSYEPTVWQTGDTVTAEKLNKLENGVKAVSEDLAGKMVVMYKIGMRASQVALFIGNLAYFNYNEETGELTDEVAYDFSGSLGVVYQSHSVSEIDNKLYLMTPEIWRPQLKNAKLVFIPNEFLNFEDYAFGGDYEITSVVLNDAPVTVVVLTGTEFHVGINVD